MVKSLLFGCEDCGVEYKNLSDAEECESLPTDPFKFEVGPLDIYDGGEITLRRRLPGLHENLYDMAFVVDGKDDSFSSLDEKSLDELVKMDPLKAKKEYYSSKREEEEFKTFFEDLSAIDDMEFLDNEDLD